METATRTPEEVYSAIDDLVKRYRSTCLWFAPKDYLPENDAQRLRTLDDIERHADREGFKRARELKEWLSRVSNGA